MADPHDGTALLTPRLRLRALVPDDAAFALELLTQASWIEFIGDKGLRSTADAERWIREGPIAMQQRHGHALRAMALRESGACVGICGLVRRDGLDMPDLGFALLDRWAGRGLALEAAQATLAEGHGALALPRIAAITTPHNTRSIALLDRLGFRALGPHRLPPPRDGDPVLLFMHEAMA